MKNKQAHREVPFALMQVNNKVEIHSHTCVDVQRASGKGSSIIFVKASSIKAVVNSIPADFPITVDECSLLRQLRNSCRVYWCLHDAGWTYCS